MVTVRFSWRRTLPSLDLAGACPNFLIKSPYAACLPLFRTLQDSCPDPGQAHRIASLSSHSPVDPWAEARIARA